MKQRKPSEINLSNGSLREEYANVSSLLCQMMLFDIY
jgi:hypothetical protein